MTHKKRHVSQNKLKVIMAKSVWEGQGKPKDFLDTIIHTYHNYIQQWIKAYDAHENAHNAYIASLNVYDVEMIACGARDGYFGEDPSDLYSSHMTINGVHMWIFLNVYNNQCQDHENKLKFNCMMKDISNLFHEPHFVYAYFKNSVNLSAMNEYDKRCLKDEYDYILLDEVKDVSYYENKWRDMLESLQSRK